MKRTTEEITEIRMRRKESIWWCVKCSGTAPDHVQAYEGYNEAICGNCFFS